MMSKGETKISTQDGISLSETPSIFLQGNKYSIKKLFLSIQKDIETKYLNFFNLDYNKINFTTLRCIFEG